MVTVSDGGTTALGTATASSTGAWSFTTADLSAGSHAFTATDTTSAGTSAASSAFDVTVLDPPTAPVISTGVANSNGSVTLTGTALDGSAVTVSDGGTTALGTATASSTGAWSFTTADLSAGSYAFTATDTTSAGTSAASSPFDVTVTSSSPPPSGSNLVANGNFATDSFSGWTLGGNYTSTFLGPEIYIDTNAEGGSTYAAGMGSVDSDGTLSQTIATTAGQTYTLSFWLQNEGSTPNDFTATWNGTSLLALTNAAQSGYTEYTYTVTATGSTSTLEFSAMQDPSQWDLDNVSVIQATAAAPVLTIADPSLSVTAGGNVALGVNVTVPETGDNVTVKITGLPSYETITDVLDGETFEGTSIELTAAEVNSGLSLHSSYTGTGHPVATLTLTATNGSGTTETTTAAQTLTVTDPPVTSDSTTTANHFNTTALIRTAGFPDTTMPSGPDPSTIVALLRHYGASMFGSVDGKGSDAISIPQGYINDYGQFQIPHSPTQRSLHS
jgi:Big-like domain-containing protein